MGTQRRRPQRRRSARNYSVPWSVLPWKRVTLGVVVLYLALQTYPLFIHSVAGRVASSWNAAMLWGVLKAIGQNPSLDGPAVVSEAVRFFVIPECTIFAPMALFTAGVLVFPSSVPEKLRALALGVLCLSLMNLLRLLTLYGVLETSPGMFDAVHLFFWQPVMAMTALVLWGLWAAKWTRHA